MNIIINKKDRFKKELTIPKESDGHFVESAYIDGKVYERVVKVNDGKRKEERWKLRN
jgi:hypothetical protein